MSLIARQTAQHILRLATEDIGSDEITDYLWGISDDGSLSLKEKSALVKEIRGLIGDAMVTVILPGDDVCPHCHGTGTPEQAESGASA